MQDLKNNAPQCDVFSTTDISHMPALRKRNEIANFVPDNAAAMAPAFHGLGEDGYFYPTTSTLMLIIYNTQKLKPEDAPRNWPDLLDPKLKGRVAFGHPAFSGYVGCWTLAMRTLYGWQYLRQAGEEQSAHRPLGQRSDHAAERRRVRGGAGAARHHVAVGGEGQSDRAAVSARRVAAVHWAVRGDGAGTASQCRAAVPELAAVAGVRPGLRQRLCHAGARGCDVQAGRSASARPSDVPLRCAKVGGVLEFSP